MKILVACEESQAVTIEMRRLGHEAYSCDIERCSILKRVETYTDTRTCVNCPLDGHCEFVVCREKECR